MATRSLRVTQHLRRRILAALSITALVCGAAVVAPLAAVAQPGGAFDPGNIISDSNFYNNNSMTTQEIQSFLDGQVPNCTLGTAGRPAGGFSTDPSSYGTLLASNCLKSYTESVNSIAADRYCDPINAGTYTGAGIIKAVSDACGISPKVMLVLLQKEQSLITDSWPSARQYSFATGFNCPDTAPCGVLSAGFFKQVYAAARQFQVYTYFADNPSAFNYHIGLNTIQFHPNTSCGASEVNIVNQATANLYIYTPYQPNESALANLYGGGDSCGAYGNRNFWRMYWDWFGSPTSKGFDEINQFYVSTGGANGPLGASMDSAIQISCESGPGATRKFRNGNLYWNAKTGVIQVDENIRNVYFTWGGEGGTIGCPSSSKVTRTGSPTSGVSQSFVGGEIFSSSLGTSIVTRDYFAVYTKLGLQSGSLGWPTSSPGWAPGKKGFMQTFEKGAIFSKSGFPPFSVPGSILAAFRNWGATSGSLGYPTAEPSTETAQNSKGLVQKYDGGAIYSWFKGVFPVFGTFNDAHQGLGGITGKLGWPTSSPAWNSNKTGFEQNFQGGKIAVINGVATTTFLATQTFDQDAFDSLYQSLDSTDGPLGMAQSSITPLEAKGVSGKVKNYANGSIYLSRLGIFASYGNFDRVYVAAGGPAGVLGWPTSGARWNASKTGFEQTFQNGIITGTGSGQSYVVASPLFGQYSAWGLSSGSLGFPASVATALTANGLTGQVQNFAGGAIYSSSLGTASVHGSYYPVYVAAGGPAGVLGWPTSGARWNASKTGFEQTFQNGIITGTGSGQAYVVASPLFGQYSAWGLSSGSLGFPASVATALTANGLTGQVQNFAGGAIYSSSLGTASVHGSYYPVYVAAGGPAGVLGWPTSGARWNASKTGFEQTFQNGIITGTGSGQAYVVASPLFGQYSAWGLSSGSLGFPASVATALTANGLTGQVQNFAGGAIYSSSLGTASVHGSYYPVYVAAGGPAGVLGWPTSGARWNASKTGFEQTFQNGKIESKTGSIPTVVKSTR